MDANDLIYSLESSGDFDAEPGLSRVKTKVLAVNFADDEFYRDSLQTLQRDIRAVRDGRFVVRAISDGSFGHMSMAQPSLWADQARDFVAWLSTSCFGAASRSISGLATAGERSNPTCCCRSRPHNRPIRPLTTARFGWGR